MFNKQNRKLLTKKRILGPKQAILVILLALAGGIWVWRSFAATPISVPSEYIARFYTESLGRLPDQQGWNFWQKQFETKGCNTATFDHFVSFTLQASEFNNIEYNNAEKVLVAYRSVLSREPDAGGFNSWKAKLDSGKTYKEMVDAMTASKEFSNLTTKICGSSDPNFHFDGKPMAIEGSMTQAQLQAQLDAAKPGQVVRIPRGTLVKVEARLTVPTGVTLTTEGSEGLKGRHAYAKMARIAYTPTAAKVEDASLVVVQSGAKLQNVWVDGQLWNYREKKGGPTVRIAPHGLEPAVVENVRSDNPRAAQNILANSNTRECLTPITIRSNLVINSANLHKVERWADGIATACANTTIEENEVLDASDVAIITYRTYGAAAQSSKVRGNRILQAGNDAFGGLVTDPLSTKTTPRLYPECLKKVTGQEANCDFSGTVFEANTLWTGKDARFVIGISVGTRAWGFFKPDSANGSGAVFTGNTAGDSEINTQIPVYISGVYNSVVTNNFIGSNVKRLPGKSGVPGTSCKSTSLVAGNKKFFNPNTAAAKEEDNDKCI